MSYQDIFLERALLDESCLAPEQIDAARQRVEGDVDLVEALLALELVESRTLAFVRATICEAPFADLDEFEVNYHNTRLIPRVIAERYQVFPLFMIDDVLTLAMDDPLNLEALDQVRQILDCEIDAVQVDRRRLQTVIKRAYSLTHDGPDALEADEPEIVASDESHPAVAAVNQLMAEAIEQGASDIHINPDEFELRLRYRIDGVLHEMHAPPITLHAAIVQRLKVMAALDLTQTRRPQDGKFRFVHHSGPVDVRLSTVPTVCGENVVIRLLAGTNSIRSFDDLGIPVSVVDGLGEVLVRPYGMLLVTGPTGSGKTTTLYTCINQLNEPSRNIMTIEDPVEIRLPYVRQIQVHNEIGLDFASALRSILRQDPDVVLVGEIRDEETATIALQAALTGHLVLSTLHTNDAAGAISRLRDFGVPSFVINSAVLGILAQRLVRRVCSNCSTPHVPTDLVRARFHLEPTASGFVQGEGCGRCGQSGYRGRVGLYEMLQFTPAVQQIVESGGSTREIRDAAIADGMRLMWQDGVEKARLGETTLEAVAKAAAVSGTDESTAMRLSA